MRMGWISGWAVPADWFRRQAEAVMPQVEHRVVDAAPDALDRLLRDGPFDRLGGYSLGSLLLLERHAQSRLPGPVLLLAPIWRFPAESGAGGRTARTQVRALARWLKRDRAAALEDFYRRAGLPFPEIVEGPSTNPCRTFDMGLSRDGVDDLAWGLGKLEGEGVAPVLPEGWIARTGSADALLDAEAQKQLVPGLEIVPGASHAPGALLQAVAEELRQ